MSGSVAGADSALYNWCILLHITCISYCIVMHEELTLSHSNTEHELVDVFILFVTQNQHTFWGTATKSNPLCNIVIKFSTILLIYDSLLAKLRWPQSYLHLKHYQHLQRTILRFYKYSEDSKGIKWMTHRKKSAL